MLWLPQVLTLASYPAFTDGGKNAWFQPFAHARNFPRNLGNRVTLVFFRARIRHNCYFGILPHNGHLQWQWRRVLISLGLVHNLHKRRIQWLEAMDKWPCGDCFTFSSVMLRDDILIENNKYCCVIMQNNGAMKIVNFTHVQMVETRHSFRHPWKPGTRLVLTYSCLQLPRIYRMPESTVYTLRTYLKYLHDLLEMLVRFFYFGLCPN